MALFFKYHYRSWSYKSLQQRLESTTIGHTEKKKKNEKYEISLSLSNSLALISHLLSLTLSLSLNTHATNPPNPSADQPHLEQPTPASILPQPKLSTLSHEAQPFLTNANQPLANPNRGQLDPSPPFISLSLSLSLSLCSFLFGQKENGGHDEHFE